jgi:hypothetical protein
MLAELSVLRACSVIRRDQRRLSADWQPNGKGTRHEDVLPRCFDSTHRGLRAAAGVHLVVTRHSGATQVLPSKSLFA